MVSTERMGYGLAQVGEGVASGLGRERILEIQRARILAAMVEECAVRGASNVTVAHIVRCAGVSRRTFYELFSDREDCFLGAFDDAISRVSRYVLDAYDHKAEWAQRIRTSLTSVLSFLDTQPGAGRLLIVGSLGAGTRAFECRRRVLTQVVAVVDEGRNEAESDLQLPPLTAEGIVGGVLSVLHARLLEDPPAVTGTSGEGGPNGDSFAGLVAPLMGMIVLPYLGVAAARKELARPAPKPDSTHRPNCNPFSGLEMRLTYRTVRVLMAIAAHPGSSNRTIADTAEVTDQGQMSKLLARLQDIGLIENTGGGATRGEPNAWTLTSRGWSIQTAIAQRA